MGWGIWGIRKALVVFHPYCMISPEAIRRRFASLSPHLNERGLRLFAASEAKACGHGGIVAVAKANYSPLGGECCITN